MLRCGNSTNSMPVAPGMAARRGQQSAATCNGSGTAAQPLRHRTWQPTRGYAVAPTRPHSTWGTGGPAGRRLARTSVPGSRGGGNGAGTEGGGRGAGAQTRLHPYHPSTHSTGRQAMAVCTHPLLVVRPRRCAAGRRPPLPRRSPRLLPLALRRPKEDGRNNKPVGPSVASQQPALASGHRSRRLWRAGRAA